LRIFLKVSRKAYRLQFFEPSDIQVLFLAGQLFEFIIAQFLPVATPFLGTQTIQKPVNPVPLKPERFCRNRGHPEETQMAVEKEAQRLYNELEQKSETGDDLF
jgi:hypothetical protein